MTTLLDPPFPRVVETGAANPSERLRATMAATRVRFTWFGVQKALTPEQKAVAAESFGAEGSFLSAGKKLFDTKHSAFRSVTAVRNKIHEYWKALGLPFPEPGVRLVRQAQIDEFDRAMTDFKRDLDEAVKMLDRHYPELKSIAAERLGKLFNPVDYPDGLIGLFNVEWDYPSVEPPDYLAQLNPALFEQEQARAAARFDEAVRLAEQAFLDEFSKLVGHLCERLAPGENGETKVFRDSAVNGLVEFFDRFRSLNVRSNEQLDELVARAQLAVRGVASQDLRDSPSLRRRITSELGRVQSSLDGLLVDRPRRRILRSSAPGGSST